MMAADGTDAEHFWHLKGFGRAGGEELLREGEELGAGVDQESFIYRKSGWDKVPAPTVL